MIKKIVSTKYVDENDFEFKFEPVEDSIKITETPEGFESRYIIQDTDPVNPREWDNMGKMVCFHNRYNLGDKTELKSDQFNGWDELEEYLRKELKAVVILPLYLYDHSGISIKTFVHGFHSAWDCGQVGFIYCTAETLKKEGLTKKQAIKNLIGEVEIYNQYLQGDIYCIVKETYNKDKEQLDYDIVGGYYGQEDAIKAKETEI